MRFLKIVFFSLIYFIVSPFTLALEIFRRIAIGNFVIVMGIFYEMWGCVIGYRDMVSDIWQKKNSGKKEIKKNGI